MDRWATPLGQFVRGYGVTALSRALAEAGQGIRTEAIYHWISGRARPRPELAKVLVLLSQGSLTLELIYDQPQVGAEAVPSPSFTPPSPPEHSQR